MAPYFIQVENKENISIFWLSNFFEESGILSKLQQGHSTTCANSKFVDDIALSLDKGQHTIAAFLDIKKAFETIDHKILLEKLKHAGVGPQTLKLLHNYVSNRRQCVLYNGNESNSRNLSTGVPQHTNGVRVGNILG